MRRLYWSFFAGKRREQKSKCEKKLTVFRPQRSRVIITARRAHVWSFDMRCPSLTTAGVSGRVATRCGASRPVRRTRGRLIAHTSCAHRPVSIRTHSVLRTSSSKARDDDCAVSWVEDPGLNPSLLCESSVLSVARRFTTQEEWDRYQSPGRYWEMLRSTTSSGTARRVSGPVLLLTLFSVAVGYAKLTFPVTAWLAQLHTLQPIVTVAGGAVTLLLAFRTNAAFARFNQATDTFARAVSATRNLSRKMVVWCPVAERARQSKLVCALPWAIKHRGQGIEGTAAARGELENVLGDDLMEALLELDAETKNIPAVVMTEITRGLDVMNESGVDKIYQLLMDNDLTSLHACVAQVDRIAATPTPVSYARHITRGVLIWLALFVASLNVTTLVALCIATPAIAFLSWLCLGIDDIGMQLEQPFTVLAVAQFCLECEQDVTREMTASNWTPRMDAVLGKARKVEVEKTASAFTNAQRTGFDDVVRPGIPGRAFVEPTLNSSLMESTQNPDGAKRTADERRAVGLDAS
jgi:putative membrane protein